MIQSSFLISTTSEVTSPEQHWEKLDTADLRVLQKSLMLDEQRVVA